MVDFRRPGHNYRERLYDIHILCVYLHMWSVNRNWNFTYVLCSILCSCVQASKFMIFYFHGVLLFLAIVLCAFVCCLCISQVLYSKSIVISLLILTVYRLSILPCIYNCNINHYVITGRDSYHVGLTRQRNFSKAIILCAGWLFQL